eukprot:TRINITY_DN15188_c0_g1_i1.p1 TRINITY_DN15188_c0_g1~~TRINITY_DN15188_c0_g1_i1.p1  ORF type:complete len:498 (+),score=144.67 TRINITY_DN15188_c0_g1_i1:27-1496(+)
MFGGGLTRFCSRSVRHNSDRHQSIKGKRLASSSFPQSRLTDEQALQKIKDSPSKFVKVAAIDIDGVPRGKYIDKEKFLSSAKSGSSFCSVVFGWDCADVLYDNTKVTGWHMAYSDFPTKMDLSTLKFVPYENNIPFVLMDFEDKKGDTLEICPRSLLKKVIKQCETEFGLTPMIGPEYEFFCFRETPKSLEAKHYTDLHHLTPGMFGYSLLRANTNREYFHNLMEKVSDLGITIEGLHTETGPGALEVALRFGKALDSADNSVAFKMAAKDIGRDLGIMPCFMAKPVQSLPGCGGHIHQSLADENGKNVFYDENDPQKMSKIFRHYIAGQMHTLPDMMAIYAPTINSYKRFVEGFWAPTTPTWGLENRTVCLRVIEGGKATRVEVRVPGADINPYLAIAASVASGLYGIRNKLELPAPTTGNAYTQQSTGVRLPKNLSEAATRLKESKVAKEILGETFVEHFSSTREWEWRQFQTAVTNWETQRYMEII